MSEECHNLFDASRDPAGWQSGPVDQDHRQAKRARRIELGPRSRAPGVFGHDELDAMGRKKRCVPGLGERAAGDDDFGVRQGQNTLGRIDEAKQIAVLRPGGEGLQVLSADGKENPCRRVGQRGDRRRDIGHGTPVVAAAGLPRRTLEAAERHARRVASLDCIPAHPGGKGMGRIDHVSDAFVPQVAHKPRDAAEAADPRRHRLCDRCLRAPGIGKHSVDPGRGERPGKLARLGRAAEKKDARHG